MTSRPSRSAVPANASAAPQGWPARSAWPRSLLGVWAAASAAGCVSERQNGPLPELPESLKDEPSLAEAQELLVSDNWTCDFSDLQQASATLGLSGLLRVRFSNPDLFDTFALDAAPMLERFAEGGLWRMFIALAAPQALLRAAAAEPEATRDALLRLGTTASADALCGYNDEPVRELMLWRLAHEWRAVALALGAQISFEPDNAPSPSPRPGAEKRDAFAFAEAAQTPFATFADDGKDDAAVAPASEEDARAALAAALCPGASVQEAARLASLGCAYFCEAALAQSFDAIENDSTPRELLAFLAPGLDGFAPPAQEARYLFAGQGFSSSSVHAWANHASRFAERLLADTPSARREAAQRAGWLSSTLRRAPGFADALADAFAARMNATAARVSDVHVASNGAREIAAAAFLLLEAPAAQGASDASSKAQAPRDRLRAAALSLLPRSELMENLQAPSLLARSGLFGEASPQIGRLDALRLLISPLADGVSLDSEKLGHGAACWAAALHEAHRRSEPGPKSVAQVASEARLDHVFSAIELFAAWPGALRDLADPADSMTARVTAALRELGAAKLDLDAVLVPAAKAFGELPLSSAQGARLVQQEAEGLDLRFFEFARELAPDADLSASNAITRVAQKGSRRRHVASKIIVELAEAGAPMRISAKVANEIGPEIAAMAEVAALGRALAKPAKRPKAREADTIEPAETDGSADTSPQQAEPGSRSRMRL
jgi:hypothetical protein